MKQNQKLLLLCGDSYQDISLLAAVNEAQKLNAKDGNALVLYLGEENAITQEAADIVVVSKLKLDALRTTLLSYTGSRLLLAFADKQILNSLVSFGRNWFFQRSIDHDCRAEPSTLPYFLSTGGSTTPLSRAGLSGTGFRTGWFGSEKPSSFLKAFNFLL